MTLFGLIRICFFILLIFIMKLSAIKYEFGGSPQIDMAFDTRHFIGTDDGATILYPAPPEYDANGLDINACAAFGMTSALSNFFLKISECTAHNNAIL